MTKPLSRWASSLAASALALGGVTFLSGGSLAQAAPGDSCQDPQTVSVFEFNDFHGRIGGAAQLFTPVETARASMGEDNVLLVSTGDNIGASTFESFINNDTPTIDIMKAAGVEAIATGNHEFDKGFTDLAERVIPRMGVPHLSANIYDKGTTTVAAPLQEYKIFEKGGVRIAYVGAVTGDLPSLVSPGGIADIEAGDPVAAVNRVGEKIKAEGLADIIIAGFHEGAPDPSKTAAENASLSPAFGDIYNELDPLFDVVFNGHTHQIYDWKTPGGKPLMQAGQYAGQLSRVDLKIDNVKKEICSFTTKIEPAAAKDAVGTQQRIQEIQAIYDAAKITADELGAEPVGFANQAISTPGKGDSGTRNVESPMSNMVAQMFKEQLQTDADADSFIGVQNPGGTRDSFNRGTSTFKEAASVLPFANTLMTTQLTGAQFKLMLEQQLQVNKDGEVPSRPYLALGLSDNVSYTFDESRDRLDRITSISIDGKPIKMDKLYTFGSGNFLISGGDNFFAFNEGINTKDSGRADLEAWVDWVENGNALSPDYSKRGVSAPTAPGTLTEGAAPVEYVLGKPLEGGVQIDTLDMLLDATGEKVSPQLKNTTITAKIENVTVGTGTVTDGVGSVKVSIPKGTSLSAGHHMLVFTVEASGTVVNLPVTVKLASGTTPPKPSPSPSPTVTVTDKPSPAPTVTVPGPTVTIKPTQAPTVKPPHSGDLYETPGFHNVNGRRWMTTCEPYSVTVRCWTYIWGTEVKVSGGKYVQVNGWNFNNLTYVAAPRSVWKGNKLAYDNEWTATDGRQWRTECETAQTGRNGCRSWVKADKIEYTGSGYRQVHKWVFNNIVRFSS